MIEGDCNTVLPSLSTFFNLAIIDLPYYVLNKANIKGFKHRSDLTLTTTFDCFESYSDYIKQMSKIIQNTCSKMKDNSTICCFIAVQYITDFIYQFELNQFKYYTTIIWIKSNPPPKIRITAGFISSYEAIIVITKGKPIFNFLNQTDMKNYISIPLCQYPERILQHNEETGFNTALHPTQKPIKLLKWLIQIFSNKQSWILDSTAGVGSTLVAANDLERNAVGIELNPVYVQAFKKRIQNTITYGKKLGDY